MQDAKEGWYFQKNSTKPVGYVLDNFNILQDFFRENGMKVSINASQKVQEFIDELIEKHDKNEHKLTASEAAKLSKLITELRIVVVAEAKELSAFFTSEKRYNVDALFDDIALIFGRTTFELLPISAQLDFSEAGKCIVLERGSAACYHLMRGSEASLKQLYFSVVKRGRMKRPMWAAMVEKLDERNALDDALKGTLDNARRGFRNPVSHPEKFFTVEEAQDLLGTTTQLMNLIAAHSSYVNPN